MTVGADLMVAVDGKLIQRGERGCGRAITSGGWRGVPPGVNPGAPARDSFCDRFSQLSTPDSRLKGDRLFSKLGWLRRGCKIGDRPSGRPLIRALAKFIERDDSGATFYKLDANI